MNEYEHEAEFWKEVVLRKYVTEELDTLALNRIVKRIYDLAYASGREDERKYTIMEEF